MKKTAFILGFICSPMIIAAGPSINEMNSCVALVDFVDTKLDEFADQYPADEITLVHKGLSGYSDYLKEDVISPKVLQMYGGNATQAALMHRLFDKQKATFFKHLNERYTKKKLFTEYAAAINDCSAKTRLSAGTAKDLNVALDLMIRHARQK